MSVLQRFGLSRVRALGLALVLVIAAAYRFLASLKAIDRHLTADRDQALSRAVQICHQVYDGKPADVVRAYARQTYAGDAVNVSSATAGKIVATVKRWICSDSALHQYWES
jgi:hypothetical protein